MKRYFFLISVFLLLAVSIVHGFQEKETIKLHLNEPEVSIEVAMPHGDSLRLFGICWSKNPVDVIVRNNSNKAIRFYQNWNSWGYFNFSFEIETYDSIYSIKRADRVWWRNFPSTHYLNPNQSLVFSFNLTDTSCGNKESAEKVLRGSTKNQWEGLPNKEYTFAQLRVIYELNTKDTTILEDRRNYGATKKTLDPIRIYSKKLISPWVGIKIKD